MTEDGQSTLEKFSAADLPSFVMEEIEDSGALSEAVLDDSGINVTGGRYGDIPGEYADAWSKIDGEILYMEMVDFEADGNLELLVLHMRNNERESELFAASVYHAEPEG